MKPTLLFAILSMGFSMPGAFAATELDTLRARCAEQERQIKSLKEQVQKLQPGDSGQKAPAVAEAPAAPSTPETGTYTVQAGDFIEKIARKTHCTPEALAKANGLKVSSIIHPGQKLKLPGTAVAQAPKPAPSPAPAPAAPASQAPLSGKTHKVVQGETYSSIARKYKVSVQSLITANPTVKPTALRPGLVIRLSSASEAAAPQQAKAPTPPPAPAPVAAAPPAPPAPKTTPVSAPAAPTAPPPAAAKKTAENPPAPPAPKPAPSPNTEKKIRSVTIEDEMTYAEFATKHGTDTGRLNDLNGLDLTNATVLAKGSELYVPAQP